MLRPAVLCRAVLCRAVAMSGMTSAWIQAMRADGPLSCYQGFGVAVLSMAAYKALYFGLYDTAKMVLLPGVGVQWVLYIFQKYYGRTCRVVRGM